MAAMEDQSVMRERAATLRGRTIAAIACATLIAAGVVGYRMGARTEIHTDRVGCLSAAEQISCEMADGWTVAVPVDVAWVDRRGSYHEGGRPACLPPSGIGEEGPVSISWVDVTVDGIGRRQVVQVRC